MNDMNKLEETVSLMLSDNYMDRLKAEYLQVVIRLDGLCRAIKGKKAGEEKYKNIDTDVLEEQMVPMIQYRDILSKRLNW